MMNPEQRRIEVSVSQQILRLYEADNLVSQWPVSTSRFGEGSEEGSYKTPLGRFRISEEFGAGEPERTIFKSRLPTGVLEPDAKEEGDLVLSRILWLEGLEAGNANTKQRYIYIHGTNHEGDIGKPASIGCVRMRNADVVALHDQVGVGTPVEILA